MVGETGGPGEGGSEYVASNCDKKKHYFDGFIFYFFFFCRWKSENLIGTYLMIYYIHIHNYL